MHTDLSHVESVACVAFSWVSLVQNLKQFSSKLGHLAAFPFDVFFTNWKVWWWLFSSRLAPSPVSFFINCSGFSHSPLWFLPGLSFCNFFADLKHHFEEPSGIPLGAAHWRQCRGLCSAMAPHASFSLSTPLLIGIAHSSNSFTQVAGHCKSRSCCFWLDASVNPLLTRQCEKAGPCVQDQWCVPKRQQWLCGRIHLCGYFTSVIEASIPAASKQPNTDSLRFWLSLFSWDLKNISALFTHLYLSLRRLLLITALSKEIFFLLKQVPECQKESTKQLLACVASCADSFMQVAAFKNVYKLHVGRQL